MDVAKLLPIVGPGKIASVIERGAPFGGEIWQSSPKGRQVLQIYKIHFDPKFDKFVLLTFDLASVDREWPIFVRLCYRNILFRLDPKEFQVRGDKLICQFPTEARGLEERKDGDRYVLPFNSDISLTLKRAERSIRETVLDLEVRIVDVSRHGFGILISGFNKDFLRSFDHFWIKAIDQRPLSKYIFGKVSYISPKGYFLKRGDVRVGLSLQSSIGEEMLEYLKKKSYLILSA